MHNINSRSFEGYKNKILSIMKKLHSVFYDKYKYIEINVAGKFLISNYNNLSRTDNSFFFFLFVTLTHCLWHLQR